MAISRTEPNAESNTIRLDLFLGEKTTTTPSLLGRNNVEASYFKNTT